MKCLLKYQWVKLPRTHLPAGKGVMGYWARLASKAAFRKGQSKYCGHINEVDVGAWSGGMVGLKSILGIKSRQKALEVMDTLAYLGYIEYTLDPKTKKLIYKINDFVVKCSGEPCIGSGAVYTTDGYGFLCLPRSITHRLAADGYTFDDADAWLDLWCHTIWQDPRNIFSFTAPAVQYGKYGAALTLETLGQRWGWEKTKVWRFLQKHKNTFALQKLPGSYGCLIFNMHYPTGEKFSIPKQAEIKHILDEIRIMAPNTHLNASDNERINRAIAMCSQTRSTLRISEKSSVPEKTERKRISDEIRILPPNTHLNVLDNERIHRAIAMCSQTLSTSRISGESSVPEQTGIKRILDEIRILPPNTHLNVLGNERISRAITLCDQSLPTDRISKEVLELPKNRVAVSAYITRAYFSLLNCRNCNYDCKRKGSMFQHALGFQIRDPCKDHFVFMEEKWKENSHDKPHCIQAAKRTENTYVLRAPSGEFSNTYEFSQYKRFIYQVLCHLVQAKFR